jgi:hypothetical protein
MFLRIKNKNKFFLIVLSRQRNKEIIVEGTGLF